MVKTKQTARKSTSAAVAKKIMRKKLQTKTTRRESRATKAEEVKKKKRRHRPVSLLKESKNWLSNKKLDQKCFVFQGVVALQQIRRLQRSTECLIRRLPFQRLVREIMQKYMKDGRIQAFALEALQVVFSSTTRQATLQSLQFYIFVTF